MSDNFESYLGGIVHSGDFHSGPAAQITADWSGGLYAPINYQPGASSYTPVPEYVGTGEHAAQDLNAKVIRQQYADYEKRFKPIEDLAVSLMTDTGTKDLPLDLQRTRETVGGVFQGVQGSQDRAMARFGQTNKAPNITGSNAEAGALVGGLNMATFADEERRMKLLGGGSTGAASVVRGDGSEGN